MKRIFALILCLLMVFSLFGCSEKNNQEENGGATVGGEQTNTETGGEDTSADNTGSENTVATVDAFANFKEILKAKPFQTFPVSKATLINISLKWKIPK